MAESDPPPGIAREFIATMNAGMLPAFRDLVVPIYRYAPDVNHARLLGTATLLAVGGQYFMVTAAHAVADTFKDGKQVDHLNIPDREGDFVPVEGRFVGDQRDKHDFAFVELAPDTVERVRTRRFLSLAEVDLTTGPLSGGWHYVHGYPEVLATGGPTGGAFRARPFTYGTTLYRGPTSFLPSFEPGIHVVIEVDPARTGDVDGGEGFVPRDLYGISGSPVWRAFRFDADALTWTPSDARVVAVETCVVRNNGKFIVRGTRWFVLLALLAAAYPDLAPAIALHNPPRVNARVEWEDKPQ